MDRKTGIIINWGSRGFGIVRVGLESSLERYFLHVSKIRSGTATPVAGMEVVFSVSDKTVQEGQLPMAIKADIIVPDESIDLEPTDASEKGGCAKDGGR
jgi:hypothetical protein